jgi:hypothetical protein
VRFTDAIISFVSGQMASKVALMENGLSEYERKMNLQP